MVPGPRGGVVKGLRTLGRRLAAWLLAGVDDPRVNPPEHDPAVVVSLARWFAYRLVPEIEAELPHGEAVAPVDQ